MKYVDESSIWGDNWQIDSNDAWFVTGMDNILCRIDLRKNEGELVASIPDVSPSKFRRNSFCMKYQNDIYCMPVFADSIWVYDIINHEFDEIRIENIDGVPINMRGGFLEYKQKIYAVSHGLRQIVEIDPRRKRVDCYYSFHAKENFIKSIKAGDVLFSLSGTGREIYEFCPETKKITEHKLPDVGRGVNTICFDGENFWMSGWGKEVYIWNKEKNQCRVIDGFPETFGIYDFSQNTDGEADCGAAEYDSETFLYAAAVGKTVWFIPFLTNKIMFADINTCALQEFDIEEEKETRESILARSGLAYKYVLEYVRDNRYIGLYSAKNNCMLEIDTVARKYTYKQYHYHMSSGFIEQYAGMHDHVLREGNLWDKEVFEKLFWAKKQERADHRGEVGNSIWQNAER